MAKRILTLCLALAIGIAFAMPASAAVQSIKVGGDITIRGIYRDNLDFMNSRNNSDNSESWIMSQTRIWVGAELTDNVSAVIRLLNERDWDSYSSASPVDLDLAYIKLKDLLVPGLTATLGRQEILLGKGFVVGNVSGRYGDFSTIRAGDLTARKSFDAWRLDYEVGTAPVAVTLFDAKLDETASSNHDLDLWGINVGYKTDNLKLEGYVLLYDKQTGNQANLYTFGARIDHNVIPGLNYNIEAALQQGNYWWNKDMEGWAGNGDISYTFQSPMQPKLGAAWYYASGSKNNYKGYFVPLFPDNLSDRIGRITYAATIDDNIDITGSNMSVPKIYASIKPSEKATLALAWFPASTIVATNGKDDLGWGLNFGANYQYTEDVSLGLCVDYARAGKAIKNLMPSGYFSADAVEVIGTVAVSF
jgi:opacity protein-like surface antigen